MAVHAPVWRTVLMLPPCNNDNLIIVIMIRRMRARSRRAVQAKSRCSAECVRLKCVWPFWVALGGFKCSCDSAWYAVCVAPDLDYLRSGKIKLIHHGGAVLHSFCEFSAVIIH